ncbi:hypothetical protein BR93DRAFT_381054 [Coniochaeta sp. PMI_546]|nr:hypothetical protein BR93DRAFT_381054 [Coniochaeta sp. PMI_546]
MVFFRRQARTWKGVPRGYDASGPSRCGYQVHPSRMRHCRRELHLIVRHSASFTRALPNEYYSKVPMVVYLSAVVMMVPHCYPLDSLAMKLGKLSCIWTCT